MKFFEYNTQGMNIITGALFALLIGVKVRGNILTDAFHKRVASPKVVSGTMTSAPSKLRCATVCSNDDTCTSFAYNKAAKFCEMSDKVISGPNKDTYVKRNKACPTDKGYKLWKFPDMNLCIRYTLATVIDYWDAERLCNTDGGHIVLIENDSMRLHLVNITTTLMASYLGWTYLDGRDVNSTDVFIDWKGDAAWLSWSPINIFYDNDLCLVSKVKYDFYHFDAECSRQVGYLLCQIDL